MMAAPAACSHMPVRTARLATLLLILLAAASLAEGARQQPPSSQAEADGAGGGIQRRKHKKHPYSAPAGMFIQERASKQLPGAGQHFSFGALKPWEDIVAYLDEEKSRKLLLVARHGQAISNYLSDTLGPDEWFKVEGTCQYDDKAGTVYNVFDADLTGTGADQATSLNSMLSAGGWLSKMSGGKPVRAIISPLTRCLHTATIVLKDLPINATNVEEFVRETLGEDTCDARRSVSDPSTPAAAAVHTARGGSNRPPRPGPAGPCSFDKGLSSTYPSFAYRVYEPEADADRSFGLLGDSDHLWMFDKREQQKEQVKRAKKFLDILFRHAPEPVVIVVTHSGFARSLLLAVEREPYRPQNAELIPVLVEKKARSGRHGVIEEEDDDDSCIDAVLHRHGEAEGVQGSHQQKQRTQCFVRRLFDRLVRALQ